MAHVRCKVCKVPKAAAWVGTYPGGCARQQTVEDGQWCCDSMRASLYESALMRAVLPDAFDAEGRIKPGRLMDALAARDEALQRMARLRGPMLVNTAG